MIFFCTNLSMVLIFPILFYILLQFKMIRNVCDFILMISVDVLYHFSSCIVPWYIFIDNVSLHATQISLAWTLDFLCLYFFLAMLCFKCGDSALKFPNRIFEIFIREDERETSYFPLCITAFFELFWFHIIYSNSNQSSTDINLCLLCDTEQRTILTSYISLIIIVIYFQLLRAIIRRLSILNYLGWKSFLRGYCLSVAAAFNVSLSVEIFLLV